MTRTSGHIPTSSTKEIMPEILSREGEDGLPKYEILHMGRGWQNRQYENTETGNVFWGEPATGDNPYAPFGFKTKDLKWNITYQFVGIRDNIFGVSDRGEPLKYGADGMTLDRLYYILVNAFNGGEDFVQAYLNEVAPYTVGDEVKRVVAPALKSYKEYVTGQKALKEELEAQEKRNIEAKERYMLENDEERIIRNELRAQRDITKLNQRFEDLGIKQEQLESFSLDRSDTSIFTKKGTVRKRLKYEDVFPEGIEELKGMKLWIVYDLLDELKAQAFEEEAELRHKEELAVRRLRKWQSRREAYQEGLKDFITDLGSGKIKINSKSWEEESERLEKVLKEDFARCLASGQVPLNKSMVSDEAIEQRRKLGLDPDANHVFYASGQFANSIVFKVRIKNGR